MLNLLKGIVGVFGGALYLQSLDALHEVELHSHVVVGKHPVAIFELLKLLHDIQVFHEVDARLFGEVHDAFLHGVGGVVNHIEVAGEAKVLRVLWHEGQMDATLLVHHDGVHQIIFIEGDGSLTDGADKAALQQADVIIVDVYVAEDVVEDGAQHVARTEELFNTGGVHTLDDGFLTPRLFAEDGTRGGLLDGDGQDLLAGLR